MPRNPPRYTSYTAPASYLARHNSNPKLRGNAVEEGQITGNVLEEDLARFATTTPAHVPTTDGSHPNRGQQAILSYGTEHSSLVTCHFTLGYPARHLEIFIKMCTPLQLILEVLAAHPWSFPLK